jgi:hypothetical protein
MKKLDLMGVAIGTLSRKEKSVSKLEILTQNCAIALKRTTSWGPVSVMTLSGAAGAAANLDLQ